jgi:hypothetical protein
MIGYVSSWHQPDTQRWYGTDGLDGYRDSACPGVILLAELTFCIA